MTAEEARNIIAKEKLIGCNWYMEHPLQENEVGIIRKENTWIVYSTGEDAQIALQKSFSNEEDALQRLVSCLRADKLLLSKISKNRDQE